MQQQQQQQTSWVQRRREALTIEMTLTQQQLPFLRAYDSTKLHISNYGKLDTAVRLQLACSCGGKVILLCEEGFEFHLFRCLLRGTI